MLKKFSIWFFAKQVYGKSGLKKIGKYYMDTAKNKTARQYTNIEGRGHCEAIKVSQSNPIISAAPFTMIGDTHDCERQYLPEGG